MGQTQSNNLWIGFVAVAAFFVLLTMVVLVVLNLRHKRKKKKEKKKLQDELYDYEMGRTEKRMTDIQAQPRKLLIALRIDNYVTMWSLGRFPYHTMFVHSLLL
eukprot:Lankesteria_metandrocarpae@DN2742_c0_g1_i1.p3